MNDSLPVFRVTFDDGDTLVTSMAKGVTLAIATEYYVGTKFEITETTFHTAVKVEQI